MNWTALIIMNNYFHDVATATLLSSAVILWVLGRQAERGGPEDRRALANAMPTLTRFAIGALIWIILGGIPRVIFFNTFEFIPAKDNGIIIDLAIKHVFLFAAVGAGAIMWLRMGKIARGELNKAQAD
ncbi:MAG: hypothetical protein P4L93_04620 [Coriobacteriia bacterium]|nr:hypothetical protein [Coriobacteriia bacterium]